MAIVNKLLKEHSKVKIETYACGSTGGERMVKKCDEVNVKFIAKPITLPKLKTLLKTHLKKAK
jgi:hypothetical protein